MLYIELDLLNGPTLPDKLIEKFVFDTVRQYKGDDMRIVIGNELTMLGFRVAAHRDEIPYNEITFILEGEEVKLDKNCRVISWPIGNYHVADKFLMILIEPKKETK